MKYRSLLLACCILLFAVVSAHAQSRVTINLGHTGPVTDIVVHPTLPLVFTAGEDGRIRIWNTELGGLQNTIQLSNQPITKLAHHPNRNEIAAVIGGRVMESTIRVIDWETETELFTRKLDGNPVFFDYSPTGSYLIYTLPTLRSLFFLDAYRGVARSYLDDGFGIVSFIQMATDERNVMTYVPTRGELIYWEIQTGRELRRVSTVARLDHIAVVKGRTLVGSRGDELVVIDNWTGDTKASYPVAPIYGITVDADSGTIYVLTQRLTSRDVLAFTYRDGRLRRDLFRPGGLAVDSSSIAFAPQRTEGQSGLMVGDSSGGVALHSVTTGRRQTLGSSDAAMITDIAFTDGRLHLSLGDRLVTLVSDVFEAGGLTLSMSYIGETTIDVPFDGKTELESDGSRLFLWGAGNDEEGTIYQLSPPSTQLQLFYTDEQQTPIQSVVSTPAGPLVIHRDGRILQLSPMSGIERFRYLALGARTATWDAQLGLIAGKTRSTDVDSSLVIVDQLTQETLLIATDTFLTTCVVLDERQNVLYSIGLAGSLGEPSTRLLRHSGPGFGQLSVLLEVHGDDTDASLVWDARNGAILSTVGENGLQRYTGRQGEPFEATANVPREVAIFGKLVASANEDGSITLWERDSGQHLFDLYIFGEADWIAITREGAYLTSSSAVEHYLQFVPAPHTRLTIEDFRITLPIGM